MGNRLALQQAVPVESFLHDLQGLVLKEVLGKSRFLKTLYCLHDHHGPVVLKVYIKTAPTASGGSSASSSSDEDQQRTLLATYSELITRSREALRHCDHLLPYEQLVETENAGCLLRQHVWANLVDRANTLPFLSDLDRLWISFQILVSLDQLHSCGQSHGDVKAENVLLTCANWALLADLAPFKPCSIPEDNPADFSFFFDSSGRRSCYIAPERFTVSGAGAGAGAAAPCLQVVTPEMDVFSAGCTIAEMFLEGGVLFDLSGLLEYRQGRGDPSAVLARLPSGVREMVLSMVQLDPAKRLSAAQYMTTFSPSVFPLWFSKLHEVASAVQKETSPDVRVERLAERFDELLEAVLAAEPAEAQPQQRRPHSSASCHDGGSKPLTDASENRALQKPRSPDGHTQTKSALTEGLVSNAHPGGAGRVSSEGQPAPAKAEGMSLLLPFLTSSMRSCSTPSSKVSALQLLLRFAEHVGDDHKLSRILPYAVALLSDKAPQVRSRAVITIAAMLQLVTEVPVSDAQLFSEYLLPALHQLTHLETEEVVRTALAGSLGSLAESARRFLESSQLARQKAVALCSRPMASGKAMLEGEQKNYDAELAVLVKAFSDIVQELLSGQSPSGVKIAFLSDIARLCIFFGQQRTNELLLPLTITFLNDKDWRLREMFFAKVVDLAAFVGRHSLETFILPCLQQSLCDREEFVIHQTVAALHCMCQLGLFRKHVAVDLARKCLPLLLHPNVWIRFGAIGVIDAICSHLDSADVYCFIVPLLRPYLSCQVIKITKTTLLQYLLPPVSRLAFVKAKTMPADGGPNSAITSAAAATAAAAPATGGPASATSNIQFAVELAASGINPADQKKLVMMEPYITACSKNCPATSVTEEMAAPGLGVLLEKQFIVRNMTANGAVSGGAPRFTEQLAQKAAMLEAQQQASQSPRVVLHEGWHNIFNSPTPSTFALQQPQQQQAGPEQSVERPNNETTIPGAKIDMGTVVATSCNGEGLKQFKPRGVHVGHLCEHSGPVTRLRVSPDNLFFVSGSYDGKVKVWDCQRLEKNATNRSRKTYAAQGGRITSLAVCEGTHSVASGSDNGSVHVFRVDYAPSTQTYPGLATLRQADRLGSSVVCLESWASQTQSLLIYGLSSGDIVGWDLRAPGEVFRMTNDPQCGLLETFVVEPGRNWLVAGTSRGFYVLWDIRFGLSVQTWRQPSKAAVRRLVHKEADLIASASSSFDDVIVWDVSTATVVQTMRIVPPGVELPPLSLVAHTNPVPPMDYGVDELRELQGWSDTALRLLDSDKAQQDTTTSGTSATGGPPITSVGSMIDRLGEEMTSARPVSTSALFCTRQYMITGGSDCCVRFWDTKGNNSYTVCGPEQPLVYSTSIIDGCTVHEAAESSRPGAQVHTPPFQTSASVFVPLACSATGVSVVDHTALVGASKFHHDTILDIQAIEYPHNKLLTAGRDGVIKVWK